MKLPKMSATGLSLHSCERRTGFSPLMSESSKSGAGSPALGARGSCWWSQAKASARFWKVLNMGNPPDLFFEYIMD